MADPLAERKQPRPSFSTLKLFRMASTPKPPPKDYPVGGGHGPLRSQSSLSLPYSGSPEPAHDAPYSTSLAPTRATSPGPTVSSEASHTTLTKKPSWFPALRKRSFSSKTSTSSIHSETSTRNSSHSSGHDGPDDAISLPWNFQHHIHVDDGFVGLPPSWSSSLAQAGFSEAEIQAINARRHVYTPAQLQPISPGLTSAPPPAAYQHPNISSPTIHYGQSPSRSQSPPQLISPSTYGSGSSQMFPSAPLSTQPQSATQQRAQQSTFAPPPRIESLGKPNSGYPLSDRTIAPPLPISKGQTPLPPPPSMAKPPAPSPSSPPRPTRVPPPPLHAPTPPSSRRHDDDDLPPSSRSPTLPLLPPRLSLNARDSSDWSTSLFSGLVSISTLDDRTPVTPAFPSPAPLQPKQEPPPREATPPPPPPPKDGPVVATRATIATRAAAVTITRAPSVKVSKSAPVSPPYPVPPPQTPSAIYHRPDSAHSRGSIPSSDSNPTTASSISLHDASKSPTLPYLADLTEDRGTIRPEPRVVKAGEEERELVSRPEDRKQTPSPPVISVAKLGGRSPSPLLPEDTPGRSSPSLSVDTALGNRARSASPMVIVSTLSREPTPSPRTVESPSSVPPFEQVKPTSRPFSEADPATSILEEWLMEDACDNSQQDDTDSAEPDSALEPTPPTFTLSKDIRVSAALPESPFLKSPFSPRVPEVFQPLAPFIQSKDPRKLYGDLTEVAEGEYGSVYSARLLSFADSSLPKVVAIKRVQVARHGGPKILALQREMEVMNGIRHEHILATDAIYVVEDSLWIRMELMERSLADVLALVEEGLVIEERVISRLAKDALSALAHLNELGIAHRDVRSDNLLLNSTGVLKLADFSNAVRVSIQNVFRNDVVGVPYWQAPEMRRGSYNVLRVDSWSLGATVWELVESSPPFADVEDERDLGDQWPPLSNPDRYSQSLQDFLRVCSAPALKRLTPGQLLLTTFIRQASPRDDVVQLLSQCRAIETAQQQPPSPGSDITT